MKFMKNKGYEETTVRKVRNDDKPFSMVLWERLAILLRSVLLPGVFMIMTSGYSFLKAILMMGTLERPVQKHVK